MMGLIHANRARQYDSVRNGPCSGTGTGTPPIRTGDVKPIVRRPYACARLNAPRRLIADREAERAPQHPERHLVRHRHLGRAAKPGIPKALQRGRDPLVPHIQDRAVLRSPVRRGRP
jgi:hypothetical protein